jgi:hypothetical protein
VSPAEVQALAEIRGYASANRVRFTRHAWERMDERGVTERDVVHALKAAASCFAQANGTWKVPSKDTSGDDLVAVVALEDGVLVVTLF